MSGSAPLAGLVQLLGDALEKFHNGEDSAESDHDAEDRHEGVRDRVASGARVRERRNNRLDIGEDGGNDATNERESHDELQRLRQDAFDSLVKLERHPAFLNGVQVIGLCSNKRSTILENMGNDSEDGLAKTRALRLHGALMASVPAGRDLSIPEWESILVRTLPVSSRGSIFNYSWMMDKLGLIEWRRNEYVRVLRDSPVMV